MGNHEQLFDLDADPHELVNLAGRSDAAEVQERLRDRLLGELYGSDLDWVKDGKLVGLPHQAYSPKPDRGLSGQRGIHWPPPPLELSGKPVGAPG